MSAGRIILLVFGIIFILVSFGLLAGGGVVLAFESAFRDSDGFYTVKDVPIRVNSPALVTGPAEINIGPGWFWNPRNPITIKVEATNSVDQKPIFIGLARTSDLDQYLSNVSYDEVVNVSIRPIRIETRHHSGAVAPPPPTSQGFWVVTATGSGTQMLQWDVASGSYTLVLMNADASSPVYVDASLGAKLPLVFRTIGWGLLIGGIVLIIIGGTMVFFAARGW
jgi:hypothetical protein